MDDVIRILRNVAALTAFCTVSAALVGYAGIQMGAPPWLCLLVAACGGPLTVLVSIKAFEMLRPSLPPDESGGPPSSGEP